MGNTMREGSPYHSMGYHAYDGFRTREAAIQMAKDLRSQGVGAKVVHKRNDSLPWQVYVNDPRY